jgi:hypothetical protein
MPVFQPCRSSGRPAYQIGREGPRTVELSHESWMKRQAFDSWCKRVGTIIKDTEYLLPKNPDQMDREYGALEWLAVVHADGNGLGQIFLEFDQHVQRAFGPFSDTATANTCYVQNLRQFSVALEEAAEAAFKAALGVLPGVEKRTRKRKAQLLPIVPLVLGGDDLTAVCDGESALAFTRKYLQAFEDETSHREVIAAITRKAIGCPRLSSCAGVAIIKPHFPFSSAYYLADELILSAKNVKKQVKHQHEGQEIPYPCSALDFHILFDSTFTELDAIRDRLTLGDSAQGKTRLTAKPYVVTAQDKLAENKELVAAGRIWATNHHCDALAERIKAIRVHDDDGRRKLPNHQLHDVREGLFLGAKQADARMRLMRKRYVTEGFDTLLEKQGDDCSLFRDVQGDKHIQETRFLDALEAESFWEEIEAAKDKTT